MLRGLLHELRNPLSSIMTAATLLQDAMQPETRLTDDENRMLLEVVKKESLRLNFILTRFSEYIKLPDPQPVVFDLSQAIHAIVRELQRQDVMGEDIELDDRLPETMMVRADESQIRQAIQYLLLNAAEAMPGGGSLTLTVPSKDNQQEVTVCIGDSGPGFVGESKSRALQLFFSSKAHHLGLGLPMAKNIIEVNGGSLWLEEPGRNVASSSNDLVQNGACVCFSLPPAN